MRTTIAIATFLAVGASAAGVGAAINLNGSDTLKDITVYMLTTVATPDCGGSGQGGTLTYAGGGSGNGQAAMLAGIQNIAPMSSALSSCGTPAQQLTAEGIGFELDGLSVVADKPTMGAATCNGANTLNTCTPDAGHATGGVAYNKVFTPDPVTGCNNDGECNDPTAGRAGIFGEFCDTTLPIAPKAGTCRYNIDNTGVPGWKKALRILFFGMSDTGTNLDRRNCQSPERKYLAAHWSTMMQDCTAGDATCAVGTVGNPTATGAQPGIRHAYRRNDESGTTDVFKGLLTTPGASQGNNIAAFCNAGTRGPEWNLASPPDKPCTADADCYSGVVGACDTVAGKCKITVKAPQTFIGTVAAGTLNQLPPTAVSPIVINMDYSPTNITECLGVATGYRGSSWTDIQDYDPIRRPCQGNGLATAAGAAEDVCSTRGDLGLVLPIWDVPLAAAGGTGAPLTDSYPTTGCSTGVFTCVAAVQTSCAPPTTYERCPDGSNPNDPAVDSTAPPTGTNLCPVGQCAAPAIQAATLDPRCQAGKAANWAAQDPVSLKTILWDGRVYNLSSWTTAGPTFKKIELKRATGLAVTSGSAVAAAANVKMTGAYYRIHSIHKMDTAAAVPTCRKTSATDTIGCLVHASPCSIGYAGNSAAVGNTIGLKVNNVDPDNKCVQCFLDNALCVAPAAPYPLARTLFLNSVQGFETLGGTPDLVNEGKMAACYANGWGADIATGLGFIPLPGTNLARSNSAAAVTPNDPAHMELPNLAYTRGKSFCVKPGCDTAAATPCANNSTATTSVPTCTLFADDSGGACSFGP